MPSYVLSMHQELVKSNIQRHMKIFCYSHTMLKINTTTSAAIDSLPKDETLVIETPNGHQTFLAKPLYNALHQHFPNVTFETLQTLIRDNYAFGLHIAKEHNQAPLQTVEINNVLSVPLVSKGSFIAGVAYPRPSAA